MNIVEQYEFDRTGYIVLRDFLSPAEVKTLAEAADRLEEHALPRAALPPRKRSHVTKGDNDWHWEAERGYHAMTRPVRDGGDQEGQTLIVEDFINFDPAFDFLVDHAPTMEYVRSIVQGPIRINNTELRVRYTGNASRPHNGAPLDHKYRYSFNADGIDAMMSRMVYFLHDVSNEEGAFSLVPGSHKSNIPSPYEKGEEPGMIGIEVKAGDALLFTESLLHGGFTNQSPRPRKTLHVGYGPYWMYSQNTATRDEPQVILPETLARYTDAQKALFRIPGAAPVG
ncbi:MAG TPA: phytanoyl-CoA dioxygenase family protein [Acidimicrobiales bacterium]|nr:phytanoyl-CoA dioxygenase family protein [Acidimicrobiales bacterium]